MDVLWGLGITTGNALSTALPARRASRVRLRAETPLLSARAHLPTAAGEALRIDLPSDRGGVLRKADLRRAASVWSVSQRVRRVRASGLPRNLRLARLDLRARRAVVLPLIA